MGPVVAAAASVVASSSVAASAAATGSAVASIPSDIAGIVATTVPSIVASALPSGVTTTAPATSSAMVMPAYIDLSAAVAGGLVGGLTAVRHRFDLIGVAALALVGGLGGGIIRDVLLQHHGIWALSSSWPLLACLAGALVASFFFRLATRLRTPLVLVGALSMGLFAVAGADKAILAGLAVVPVILLGTITAVGGGVLTSMLLNEVPAVLKPGTLSATAAVAGATLYVVLVEWLGIVKPIAMAACVAVIVALRLFSIWLKWETPAPPDLSGAVLRLPRRFVGRSGSTERPDDGYEDDSTP